MARNLNLSSAAFMLQLDNVDHTFALSIDQHCWIINCAMCCISTESGIYNYIIA